jgi:hypothetical protein
MPENAVSGHVCAALVHMKIGPADVSSGDTDQYIGRLLDCCILDILDRDLAGTVIYKRFHGLPLSAHIAPCMRSERDGRFAVDEQF